MLRNLGYLKMKVEERNSYIINHSLKVYLVAAILSSIVNQLNDTIDGIIVSNAVGADAISAITLTSPVSWIVTLVGSFITAGAVLLMAPALGNQQYRQVNNIYTISLSGILLINGILAVLFGILADPIAHLLTDENRLLPLMIDYMPFAFVADVLLILFVCLSQFVEISGHPRLVTRSIVAISVSNILFDLLFVVAFDGGMKGAAIATALSTVVGILALIPYILKKPRPFFFHFPQKSVTLGILKRCMIRGIPDISESIALIVLFLGMNAIVLNTQGPDGMFILSVCLQTLSLSWLISGGAGDAITGIGGVLFGEQDWSGLNRLLNKICIIMVVGAAITTLVLFLFPTLMARVFGADEALIAIAEQPLRQFSLVMIPFIVVTLQIGIYQVIDKGTLSSVITIGLIIFVLATFLPVSYLAPSYLWASLSASMWLLMFCSIGLSCYLGHKNLAHWFYLTPLIGSVDSHAVSVKYDFNDVQEKFKDLLFYISIFDLDEERMRAVEHSLEEVMINQYEMGVKEQKEGTFDVNVVDEPERFTIIVKDVGKAYNPLISFKLADSGDIDEEKLSIMMIQGICDEVNYKYLNGINCLYLNIKKRTKDDTETSVD